MYFKKKTGFTLVELIVVITILAILGTIGFISLQGYSASARESVRMSDLNIIAKSLELFRTAESYYPDPTSPFDITYTGALAWQQGVFGEDTLNKIQNISEVPTDPLTKNPYAYSLTNTKQEYELGAISEKGLSLGDIFPQTYAANSYYSLVKGNYNQKFVTVRDISSIYLLGVPTIITSEINSVTVEAILANQSFAIRNTKTLPGSYASSLPVGETIQDGISFTPGPLAGTMAPVIYVGSITALNDDTEKQKFGENLVSYYQNSDLTVTNIPSAADIFTVQTGQELSYVNTLITGEQGGLSTKEFTVNNTVVATPTPGFTLTGPFDIYDYSNKNTVWSYPNYASFVAMKSDGSITAWGGASIGWIGAPTGTGYIGVYPNTGAFAAMKSDGSITAWGSVSNGGSGAPTGTGYIGVYSDAFAFAAMKSDGSITAWGDSSYGGSGAPTGTGYTKIYSTNTAFAAMKPDGSITAWGTYGGSGAPTGTGYTRIYSNVGAFAAMKSDGSITAWGDASNGGTGAPTGTGYTKIYSTQGAFAALKSDGSITAWGSGTSGGTGAPTGTGYTKIYSTNSAFAAMKSDGSITAWGYSFYGGTGAPTETGYTNIFSNNFAFAAMKPDGSITTWGYGFYGGTGAPTETGYTNIFSTQGAFAALKSDGSISAWGSGTSGGTGAPTGTGYTKIYSTNSAFAAMKPDGSITAWGDASNGGTGAPTGTGYIVINGAKQ